MPTRVFYADEYVPDFGVPWPERRDWSGASDEEVRARAVAQLRVEEAARQDLVQFGWTLPSWREVMGEWGKWNKFLICGGNRACVRGDTKIYNPVSGTWSRIDQIKGRHHVFAWDGHDVVVAEAEEPFTKPAGRMLRVVLDSGEEFVAAEDHWVLDAELRWLCVKELKQGFSLFLPASISEQSPSGRSAGVQRLKETQSGFPGDCRCEHHLYDEQPRSGEDSDRGFAPSQGDAPKHNGLFGNIFRWLWRLSQRLDERKWDDRDSKPEYIRRGLLDSLLSSSGVVRRLAGRCAGTLYRAACRLYKLVSRLSGHPWFGAVYRQSISGSCPSKSTRGFVKQGNRFSCFSYVKSIEEAGTWVKWDMSVPAHGNYYAGGAIHHNTKTTFMARLVVDFAIKVPEARVRCWHVNEAKSIAEQQSLVWEALPKRFKGGRKKGENFSLAYTQKNGFAGGKLILPPQEGYERGSEVEFNFYQQYRNDPQIAEGWRAHLIWCDEEAPQKLFETLKYRLIDLNGRLFLTFTALNGWTALVADIMSRKRVLRKRYAPLLKREIAVAEESLSAPGTRIAYFWTEDNPFIPTEEFLREMRQLGTETILCRAYGIPTRSSTTKFPKFDEGIHVVPHDKLPWMGNPDESADYTRYHVIDPSEAKPWFMIWAAVAANGSVYVYREWPDESYGKWGEQSENPDGKRGEAQKDNGFGITDYKELLAQLEEGEQIFERFIDPRRAASKTLTKEGVTNIQNELEEVGISTVAAPGLQEDEGLFLINDRLAYDAAKPIGPLNHPRLYISERCVNLVEALKNYTAHSKDEVWKDPIDCLRYLLVAGADHVDAKRSVDTGGRGSY